MARRSFSRAFAGLLPAALVLLAATGAAHATHGGPTTLEVLGQDGDQKVYLLRHSEGGEGLPPALLYFRLDQPGARLHEAASFAGDRYASGAHARFDAKLKALKVRLAPLKNAPPAAWSVKTAARGEEACPQAPFEERNCAVLDAHFQAAGQYARRRFYAWPGPRKVASAWQLSDGSVLFIYRYTGVTMETGYARDDAVLVRPVAASVPSERLAWSQGCSKTSCAVKVGARYVIKARRGLIKCVPKDGWLGCLHAPRNDAHNQGWFVRLSDGQVTQFGAQWTLETQGPEQDERDLTAPRWDGEFLVWLGERFRRPPQ